MDRNSNKPPLNVPVYLRIWFFILLFLVGFFGVAITPWLLLLWPIDIGLIIQRVKWSKQNQKSEAAPTAPEPLPEKPIQEQPKKLRGRTPYVPPAMRAKAENPEANESLPSPISTTVESSEPELPSKPTEDSDAKAYKIERHHVAGTSYRQKELESLGFENRDYELTKRELIDLEMTDQRIYQYEFPELTVELIEEPDNPYDANAIKVVVADVHIGYIKKGSCAHIKKLMRENRIINVSVDIRGGRWKVLFEDFDDYDYEKVHYTLDRDRKDYYAILTITVNDV